MHVREVVVAKLEQTEGQQELEAKEPLFRTPALGLGFQHSHSHAALARGSGTTNARVAATLTIP